MLATLLTIGLATDSLTYSGARQELKVRLPRLEETVVVDGSLDEAAWPRAARLTDFSQFSPSDGRLAEERTEVLVWYSPTAVHFGVRAVAAPGTVRAHLADRDRGIVPDDYIEIQIGTFNDGQQAFVFGANPLGVQADGALVEGNAPRGRGDERTGSGGNREQADLSPDYVWDSKGRLTESGYELEIRIPFKSLRYQQVDPQTWALQIIRKSAASGREDTWAPARRAASSFMAQAGSLVGLTQLRRGLVLELNPVATSTVTGLPAIGGGWDYRGGKPEIGGNLKWGVTTGITVNGTANPDFSQVESDAGQISPDPRSTILFEEKRPFFLDGIEYFSTPSQVIYTRRVAAPLGAVKVTGRAQAFKFGFLSAIDDKVVSDVGKNPVFNLVRLQRDLGNQSRVGMAYTDRIEGSLYNRVGEVDARILFGRVYSLSMFAALARTRTQDTTTTAPAWNLTFARVGRTLGINTTARGFHPDFLAGSGFVNRGDLAQLSASTSITLYGARGALVERFTGGAGGDLTFIYRDLFDGRKSLERKSFARVGFTLRGGWTVGSSVLVEQFSYDRRFYQDYAIVKPTVGAGADTIPYNSLVQPDLNNLDLTINIQTPQVRGFQANGSLIVGQDENFFEWSNAWIWFARLGLQYRPTDKLRFDSSLNLISYRRRSDGTIAGDRYIPRLKVEYQVSRAIFLRAVGEYTSIRQDDLRDDGRTNLPIVIRDPADGIYKRSLASASSTNRLRVDWLFSLQPTPGTVFFAGYGSSLTDDESFKFRRLARLSDAFFTKLSYNFRL
jgi:hypothetical protein